MFAVSHGICTLFWCKPQHHFERPYGGRTGNDFEGQFVCGIAVRWILDYLQMHNKNKWQLFCLEARADFVFLLFENLFIFTSRHDTQPIFQSFPDLKSSHEEPQNGYMQTLDLRISLNTYLCWSLERAPGNDYLQLTVCTKKNIKEWYGQLPYVLRNYLFMCPPPSSLAYDGSGKYCFGWLQHEFNTVGDNEWVLEQEKVKPE